ncbi:MAG: UDP-2,3-diacylglucosamine diphosphatase [candidate division WOR-3 bacterium]
MHIFFSDAHIRNSESERARILIRFLNEYGPTLDSLFILGDLFEFWFEYKVVFPKHYFKVLAILYSLIQQGKKIYYILGNHEVLAGDFLKNFGFIVYEREAVLSLGGKRILLAHGHRVDKRLWTLVWEAILKSKLNHNLYQMVHPDLGIYIAQAIAFFSRKQRRSPTLVKNLERYAVTQFGNFDIVILAHSHIPTLKVFNNNKYYINTGDWVDNFSYLVIDEKMISLNYYNQRNKNLVLTLD